MKTTKHYRTAMAGLAILALSLAGVVANAGESSAQPAATAKRGSRSGDPEVEWRQIVGIIQPANTVGSGSGKVTGGGQPWHTTGGSAELDLATGQLTFRVEGLVFAGGNPIGTPDGVTSVKGTLVCDTTGAANGNSVVVDSPLVTLDSAGNARFHGDVGPLPPACTTSPNIAFLIRVGGGAWIAGGMVRVTETDRD